MRGRPDPDIPETTDVRFGCRIFSKCLFFSYDRAGCLPDSRRMSCLVRDSCTAVSPQDLQTSLCCHLGEVIKPLGALPCDSLPLSRCRFFLLLLLSFLFSFFLSSVFFLSFLKFLFPFKGFLEECVFSSVCFLLFTLDKVLPALLCHVAGIHVMFSDGLLSPRNMHLNSLHMFSVLDSSLLFSAE